MPYIILMAMVQCSSGPLNSSAGLAVRPPRGIPGAGFQAVIATSKFTRLVDQRYNDQSEA